MTLAKRMAVVPTRASSPFAASAGSCTWGPESSLVPAAAMAPTMLLLLQGQRGVSPKQRFVTASLRVDYEKDGEAW